MSPGEVRICGEVRRVARSPARARSGCIAASTGAALRSFMRSSTCSSTGHVEIVEDRGGIARLHALVELHQAVPVGLVALLARGLQRLQLASAARSSSSTRAASRFSAAASTASRDASAASRASSSARRLRRSSSSARSLSLTGGSAVAMERSAAGFCPVSAAPAAGAPAGAAAGAVADGADAGAAVGAAADAGGGRLLAPPELRHWWRPGLRERRHAPAKPI